MLDARASLVGGDVEVPLVFGGTHKYVNLDYAASAPPLVSVANDLAEFIPWYSSVHRGAGFKSQIATNAYEGARESVRLFLAARPDDAVIFTRNTTDAINLMARSLPETAAVVTTAAEHHANMLPWRSHHLTTLDIPSSIDHLMDSVQAALRRAVSAPVLLAVTGASNVTGEVWPLRDLAALAHAHNARILVDAAQLAPHWPLNISDLDIDYVAMSGHKMYAPYGAGALVGRPDWLNSAEPYLRGGGSVELVTQADVFWKGVPDRHEGGTPNVLGAVALGLACDALLDIGVKVLAEHESKIRNHAVARLAAIPGVTQYALWTDACQHIGVVTINLTGYDHSHLAAILSAEFGVGVRHGCFCAHPLLVYLLKIRPEDVSNLWRGYSIGAHPKLPGAVRLSFGLGTTIADIDYTVDALHDIARRGPRWQYSISERSGEYIPDPDPRIYPKLRARLAAASA